MRALLTEERPGDCRTIAEALERRGHVAQCCHERTGEDGRCLAVRSAGWCPLDTGDIDVMVDVRGAGSRRMAAREFGVVCALRAGTPVVVASDSRGYVPDWAAESCPLDQAVQVAETLATGMAARAHRDVTDAVRLVLRGVPDSGPARVLLHDHGYFVEAEVQTAAHPGEDDLRRLQQAVRQALRPYRSDWVHASLRVTRPAGRPGRGRRVR